MKEDVIKDIKITTVKILQNMEDIFFSKQYNHPVFNALYRLCEEFELKILIKKIFLMVHSQWKVSKDLQSHYPCFNKRSLSKDLGTLLTFELLNWYWEGETRAQK